MESFFKERVQSEFMSSSFNGPRELHVFLSGMLSRKSNQELQDRIKRLASTFDDLHREGEVKEVNEKFGASMVIAMRPWDIKIFEQMRKPNTYKVF